MRRSLRRAQRPRHRAAAEGHGPGLLSNGVVKSLLCYLHERREGLLPCRGYFFVESYYFLKFHSQSQVKTRHLKTYRAAVTNRSTGLAYL